MSYFLYFLCVFLILSMSNKTTNTIFHSFRQFYLTNENPYFPSNEILHSTTNDIYPDFGSVWDL